MNETKKIILSAVIVVVVIVLLGVGIMIGKKNNPADTTQDQNSETTSMASNNESQTRGPAPKNVDVPDMNSPVDGEVAKPTMVMPSAPGSSSDFRNFEIAISNGKFEPSKIIVSSGDVLSITIKALDANYDFTQPDYGIYQTIKKGDQKTISFQSTAAGTFKFFCAMCGGLEKGPVGELIVAN